MNGPKPGGYEAHMTFDREHADIVQRLAERFGWTYSVITGCPLLGQGTYCYLTSYSAQDPAALVKYMDEISLTAMTTAGVGTLRAKVEHILYDTKTGVDELTVPVKKCWDCDRPLTDLRYDLCETCEDQGNV